MIQCKWAQLLFNIFHFQFWQVILTLESDAVVSVVCFIYFSSPNFRTSVIVREAAKVWPGNIIRAFTSNTTLPKIWNLRNLFHAWRRNVKYQRLGLKEVNVTFITYFSEEKQQRKIWKIELVWHFFSFISLLGQRFAQRLTTTQGMCLVSRVCKVCLSWKLIWWQHSPQTEQIMSQLM